MHSRIIQLATTPIEKDSYISANDYYESWFVNSIADYVSDDCDIETDLEFFLGNKKGLLVTNETVIVFDKRLYFAKAYEEFVALALKLSEVSIKDFMSGAVDMDVYHLNENYEDKYDVYIDLEGDLMTLSSFVRQADAGRKYFIGGMVDYHH